MISALAKINERRSKMTRKYLSIGIFFVTALILFWQGSAYAREDEVVVYVSEDQVFSEPILKDFEKESGIKVRAVYDTEEAKGTGVMNRLIMEKNNPQADVYWANEPIRAVVLKQSGITTPYISPNAKDIPDDFKDPEGYWTCFSSRMRVLVVNDKVSIKPSSILAYTDPQYKGKSVITNPLFGTTTAQVASLFTIWGEDRTKSFMEDMKKNGVKISTNNGESADLVAAGEFDFSLVDSDDVINRIRQGKSIAMIFPDQKDGEIGCLLIPNAAVIIKNASHLENAKKLVDYLLSQETEQKLAFADCAQIPLHPGVKTPSDVPKIENIKFMKTDYAKVAKKLQEIQTYLKEWVGY
jgi:iron(III) transport system substrate-binding protein